MALRNDKEIMLAALAVAKNAKSTFELAGPLLQSDPDIRRAAGDHKDEEDPEEGRVP